MLVSWNEIQETNRKLTLMFLVLWCVSGASKVLIPLSLFVPGIGSWCVFAEASLKSDRISENVLANPAQSKTLKTRSGCPAFLWDSSEKLPGMRCDSLSVPRLSCGLRKVHIASVQVEFPLGWWSRTNVPFQCALMMRICFVLSIILSSVVEDSNCILFLPSASLTPCNYFFFILAALISALLWFRHMGTVRLCWRRRKQKN